MKAQIDNYTDPCIYNNEVCTPTHYIGLHISSYTFSSLLKRLLSAHLLNILRKISWLKATTFWVEAFVLVPQRLVSLLDKTFSCFFSRLKTRIKHKLQNGKNYFTFYFKNVMTRCFTKTNDLFLNMCRLRYLYIVNTWLD